MLRVEKQREVHIAYTDNGDNVAMLASHQGNKKLFTDSRNASKGKQEHKRIDKCLIL